MLPRDAVFQHTAARRRLESISYVAMRDSAVSTHSRPKAAGHTIPRRRLQMRCFNTQPPEGGWKAKNWLLPQLCGFNTQPPEGGWGKSQEQLQIMDLFQHTAARRRLVGRTRMRMPMPLFQHTAARRRLVKNQLIIDCLQVSTHSRPKAAGRIDISERALDLGVSTHSRPKAAGRSAFQKSAFLPCFNTQPPEGGWGMIYLPLFGLQLFQHTAARRRLGVYPAENEEFTRVSTHSRPKAAGLAMM